MPQLVLDQRTLHTKEHASLRSTAAVARPARHHRVRALPRAASVTAHLNRVSQHAPHVKRLQRVAVHCTSEQKHNNRTSLSCEQGTSGSDPTRTEQIQVAAVVRFLQPDQLACGMTEQALSSMEEARRRRTLDHFRARCHRRKAAAAVAAVFAVSVAGRGPSLLGQNFKLNSRARKLQRDQREPESGKREGCGARYERLAGKALT